MSLALNNWAQQVTVCNIIPILLRIAFCLKETSCIRHNLHKMSEEPQWLSAGDQVQQHSFVEIDPEIFLWSFFP